MRFQSPVVSRDGHSRGGLTSTGASSGSDRESLSASPESLPVPSSIQAPLFASPKSKPIFIPEIPAPQLPRWDAPKWDAPKWDAPQWDVPKFEAPVPELEPEENRLPIFRSLSISDSK